MDKYLHAVSILPAIRAGIIAPTKFQPLLSSFIIVNRKFIKFLTWHKLHDIISIIIKKYPDKEFYYAYYAMKSGDFDTIKHMHEICGKIESCYYKKIVKESNIEILQFLLDTNHLFVIHHIEWWVSYYNNKLVLEWVIKNVNKGVVINVEWINKFHGDTENLDENLLSRAINANNVMIVEKILETLTNYKFSRAKFKRSNLKCFELLDKKGANIVRHLLCTHAKMRKNIIGTLPLWFKIKMREESRLLIRFIMVGSLADVKLFKKFISEGHLGLAIQLNHVDIVRYIVKKCRITTTNIPNQYTSLQDSNIGLVDKRRRAMIMKLLK